MSIYFYYYFMHYTGYTREHCYPLQLQGFVVTSATCQQITFVGKAEKKRAPYI